MKMRACADSLRGSYDTVCLIRIGGSPLGAGSLGKKFAIGLLSSAPLWARSHET
jgi:hypothetical protein